MDGKLRIYRRERSPCWQCSTYLEGRNYRQSTGHRSSELAIIFAREWFLDRLAEKRLGLLKLKSEATIAPVAVKRGRPPAPAPVPAAPVPSPRRLAATPPVEMAAAGEKTFRDAAKGFLKEFAALTEGERNEEYSASKERIIRLRLMPFFGDLPLSQITAGKIRDYRVHLMTPPELTRTASRNAARFPQKPFKRPSRSTVHHDIVCLRQVLKTAARNEWIGALPDMSAPYNRSGKIAHRAWFSPEELARFLAATEARARDPLKEQWRDVTEHFRDYVLFMVSTGLRPDEAGRLQFRDLSIVTDADTSERILEIEVRGKRGVGYCKSMPEAVEPFERVKARKKGAPTDLVFGKVQRELMNTILGELGLKSDRDGNQRTAYSLRHTYICLRLLDHADIYQLAKNCRTSVEMIERFYAAHLKNVLDASAFNGRKPPEARMPARQTPRSPRTMT
jgi:integrase